jgi:hypothetical protein
MVLLLPLVVVVVLILGAALALVFLYRPRPTPPPIIEAEPDEDPAVREARHRVIDERGSELLGRRVDLDLRRGTLTGDSEVYDALDHLESQFRAGEISEVEFEAGKIRILGG